MKRRLRAIGIVLAGVLVWVSTSPTSAQLMNKQAPVIVGHYHLNVTSVDAHRKFWVDTLGGTAMKVGRFDVVKFPDVFLFLQAQAPSGPTRGTTFDHIGFAVPNVGVAADRAVKSGYTLTVGRETKDQQAPPAAPGTSTVYGRFAYLVGPDGVKVELVTNDAPDAPPIKHHHVHFVNKPFVEMQQWYMKAFDATLRPGQTDFFIGADLPGVGYMLNFFRWELDEDLAGTKGRAVDHVGFEVKNLEEFCRRLEAKGIRLTVPYQKAPELDNIGTAFITDPWGTLIELTEGLDKVS